MAFVPQHQTTDLLDPFADFETCPSLSFAQATPGTVYKGTICRLPVERQDRDIQTKEPKTWKDGSPQMCVVLHVTVETSEGPQERSVWAKKPSSLYRALGQAQKDSGQRFALGGTLYIKLERFEASKTPGFSPQKIYAAKYEPPVTPDPWGTSSATQAVPASPAIATPPPAPTQIPLVEPSPW